MKISIKQAVFATRNKGHIIFPKINAFHHTIFDNLPRYKHSEYKKFQSKYYGNGVRVIALNDHENVLEKAIGNLHTRRYENRKKVYLHEYLRTEEKITISKNTYSYKLKSYCPFRRKNGIAASNDVLLFKMLKEDQSQNREIKNHIIYWDSPVLLDILTDILMEDISFMYYSLTSKELHNVQISIHNTIQSYTLKNVLVKHRDIYEVCFDFDFECNMIIPEYIGVGQHIGISYGIITSSEHE